MREKLVQTANDKVPFERGKHKRKDLWHNVNVKRTIKCGKNVHNFELTITIAGSGIILPPAAGMCIMYSCSVFQPMQTYISMQSQEQWKTKDPPTCMHAVQQQSTMKCDKTCQQIAINILCSRYNLYLGRVYCSEEIFAFMPKLTPATPQKSSGNWKNSERPRYSAVGLEQGFECQLNSSTFVDCWSFSPFCHVNSFHQ